MGKSVRACREHVPEWLGTSAQCAAGVLNYPPLLQISSRRECIINRSDHECQKEGRHSPNVFPWYGSFEDLIPCCPLTLLALLHCQSDSFRFLSPSLLNYHGCFGWCICLGPSLKVVPSDSWRSTWMGPLISSKAKIACDFSISSCALNFRPERSCGITSRTLLSLELLSDQCSDFTDFVFFNNGPERQPQSCAPTVESDRRYWWWQPQPLPVHWLISLSISSTDGNPISYMVSNLSSLGKRTNCKSQNLPWRGVLAIAFNPSDILLTVAVSWFLSRSNSPKTLPRLFTGSSDTVGMRCRPIVKYTSLRTFPLVRERLRYFAGLRAQRHQRNRSLSLSRTLWKICFKTIVVSSMNAIIEGMYTRLPMSASGIPAPTAFRTICMASYFKKHFLSHGLMFKTSPLTLSGWQHRVRVPLLGHRPNRPVLWGRVSDRIWRT